MFIRYTMILPHQPAKTQKNTPGNDDGVFSEKLSVIYIQLPKCLKLFGLLCHSVYNGKNFFDNSLVMLCSLACSV